MTALPPNKTATVINAVIKNANSVGIQFVQNLVIADVPWLGLPVIKQVFGLALGWLDQYLSKAEQTGATFVIIDVQVGNEESAISKALAGILAAQQSGDKVALTAALKAYALAQSVLLHDDGSAPPS